MALVVYAATLMPGMAFDDWGEMQTVPHVLGVAHPTGYPTYILIAWLFELLPIGSVAWRANLLSAVCVAVALGTLTAIAQRVGVRWWLAVLAALATGAIATVWSSAVVAEVNPLHLALMALLIHRSLVWADEQRVRDLALGGLIVGLGAGNHLLTLFVAPFFVVFALWAGRHALRERPIWLLAPIAAGAAGLAVYLYIPIAALGNPPLPYNHPVTLEGIRFLVTGEQFRGQFSGLFTTDSFGALTSSLPGLVDLASNRATPVFPILGLLGLGLLVRRRVAFGLACWGALVLGIDVWANYLHLEHYLLVPWLLIGIGVAVTLTPPPTASAACWQDATSSGPSPSWRVSWAWCSWPCSWSRTCRAPTAATTRRPGTTSTRCSTSCPRTPRCSPTGRLHRRCGTRR